MHSRVLYNGKTSWFKHWVEFSCWFRCHTGQSVFGELKSLSDVWLCVCVCVSSMCVCLMWWENPHWIWTLDFSFAHISVICQKAEYVTQRKKPWDIWQIILICSYTITTTNPKVKLGILNLFTHAGGNKVTLVKQLSVVQTLPLVK